MNGRKDFLHAAVGNINIDLTIHLSKLPDPDDAIKANSFSLGKGGGALNYSVAAARFGHHSRLVGVAGKLFFDLGFQEELRSEGVDISSIFLMRDELPGFSTIINVEGEQRRLITYRGANSSLSPAVAAKGILAEPIPNVVHFASVSPKLFKHTLDLLGIQREKMVISYDPGTETLGNEEEIRKTMELADIVFLNEKEAKRVIGTNTENYLREKIERENFILVLKKGSRGGSVITAGESFSREAPIIKPVDTTGAGDAFDAVFNGCYIERGRLGDCLELAVAAGSLKSLHSGSSSSPTRAEIEKFLKK
ncbi:MAG: PfkB family carbohydrate kinase [Fervidicoccaceae archaeon]